ncbi:hypothetical protein [Rhizobium gallicum]|uniref:hypothetical protein n=1 Tax=Rhizobium gallicum TaxID=56730 RepID=UPI001EF86F05|nr:hypothetical protein [Rhizobium gallicum]ULJ70641.1 hypothetical protein L2W42_11785 [Rhizobium gallicum]
MSRSNSEPEFPVTREGVVTGRAPKTVADVLVGKAYEIAALNFLVECLTATICSLREEVAELNAEIGTLSRTIHDLRNPPPPPEPAPESWQRLYADYRRYRWQVGYPGDKGSRR